MIMSGFKEKEYETPATRKSQIELEDGFMAGFSKEKIVTDDKNTTVDIERHEVGGDFELDKWNE